MKIWGKDAYMYSDVMALFWGREVAEYLEKNPSETFAVAIEAFESAQETHYNALSQDWIEELKNHPTPIDRLHKYLTTMEDEGQQFRSSFPFHAFPARESKEEVLERVLSICDENWMIWKRDIPA
ncbi:hypothetical protein QT970_03465 [Microcoleus sp. herbarium8]|uniref:hypothetical protein n=1 Tax=Microcoleus sp. herbarium8 TaxID=3055436 RepID=UPI002FD63F24